MITRPRSAQASAARRHRRHHALRSVLRAVLAASLLLPGIATAQTGAGPSREEPSATYAVGIGDLLRVSIWKNDELEVTVPVRPDGWVSLPLVGDVEVAGLSTERIREELTRRYEEFINAPALTVMITEINSRKVYILGEVEESGVYDILQPTSLLQALAMAGGFTEFAKRDSVVLLRQDPQPGRREINIKKITSGELPDVPLRPGDTIVVP